MQDPGDLLSGLLEPFIVVHKHGQRIRTPARASVRALLECILALVFIPEYQPSNVTSSVIEESKVYLV
jgi:hypothetical protein